MADSEVGWLPDYIFRNGRFECGVAFFADRSGIITRFSSERGDLSHAQRLSNRAVIPGLVNAHSHTFQRAIRGLTERRSPHRTDSFWTWREKMYHAAERLSPDNILDVAKMAFLEMLASGITTAGEFHYLHHAPGGKRYDDRNLLSWQVIRAARETGIRLALLKTAYVRGGWNVEASPQQLRFITLDPQEFITGVEDLRHSVQKAGFGSEIWVGVAPHSVRAVPLPMLLETVRYARSRGLPLHMHVAEQPAEIAACEAEHGLRPFKLFEEHGVLDRHFTAIHATHTTPQEVDFLAQAGAHVCVCPTTERNLGDGIAQADAWAARNISVCFGTDSNVQIDPWEDVRELEYHLRLQRLERNILDPASLLASATASGARSLKAAGGELEVGRPADFVSLDLIDPAIAGAQAGSLLAHLLVAGQRAAVRDVYIAGRQIITDGRHPDQEQITRRFIEVQQQLWGDPI